MTLRNNLIILSFTFFLFHISLKSQTFQWVNAIGGTGDDRGVAIVSDQLGNVYSTGFIRSTVDFDPGTNSLNLNSNGNRDIFLAKYDPKGKLIWANSFGSSGRDQGQTIVLDSQSNIYIAGGFSGTVDFDPDTSSFQLTATGEDGFVAKYDSSGKFLWAEKIGGSQDDEVKYIELDNHNNLFVGGDFKGQLNYKLNNINQSKTSNGDEDIFISKLDSNGNILWLKTLGGTGLDEVKLFKFDSKKNLILTGRFSNTVDFDPGTNQNSHTSNGSNDIYLLKLDSLGNYKWSRSFGGFSSDIGNSISITQKDEIITVGSFAGSVDFNPNSGTKQLTSNGSIDGFIQKLNSNGNFKWAIQLGGNSVDGISFNINDSLDNTYFLVNFSATVDLNPGNKVKNLTSSSSRDLALLKLDSLGKFIWVNHYKSNGSLIGNKIVIKEETLFLSGSFDGTADFHTSASSIPSNGNRDIYIIKVFQCDTLHDTLTINSCGNYTSPSGKHTWTQSGTFRDTIIDSNNCVTDFLVNLLIDTLQDTLNINACGTYTSPSGNHTWTQSGTFRDTTIDSNNCATAFLINLSLADINDSIFFANKTLFSLATNASLQWLDCDSNFMPIPAARQSFFQPIKSGNYAVEITKNNCVDTSRCVNVLLVGLEQVDLSTDNVSVFPNPNQGQFKLKFDQAHAKIQVELRNVNGQVVRVFERPSVKGEIHFSTNLPSGIYFLKIENEDKILKFEKLIIRD